MFSFANWESEWFCRISENILSIHNKSTRLLTTYIDVVPYDKFMLDVVEDISHSKEDLKGFI